MSAGCGCGKRWTSLTQAHCPSCHEHFSTVQAFDLHRHDGSCVPPQSVCRRDGRARLSLSDRSPGTWVRNP